MDDTQQLKLSSDYFEQATSTPSYIVDGLLTNYGKVPVKFFLYRGKSKRRQRMRIEEKYY